MAKLFTTMYKAIAPAAKPNPSLKERISRKINELTGGCHSAELITSLKAMGLRMRVDEANLLKLHHELTQHNLSYKLNSLESEIPLLVESMNMTLETMNNLFRNFTESSPGVMELKTHLEFYFKEMIAQKFLYLVNATCSLKSGAPDRMAEKLKEIFSMDNCFEVFSQKRGELMSEFRKIQDKDQLVHEIDKFISRVNELIPLQNDNKLTIGN